MNTCGSKKNHITGVFCPEVNDSLHCWPATPANTTAYLPCEYILKGRDYILPEHTAFRTCLSDGTWLDNWTNYSACMGVGLVTNESVNVGIFPNEDKNSNDYMQLVIVLKDLMVVTTAMSLIFLIVALFIFSYFRSLQCSRNSIHKNLVSSFIFRFILVLVQFQPYITGSSSPSYRDMVWLCKAVQGFHQYFQMSNFAWMLVEGIYLHNRLVVTVFPSAAPFKLFYFIGWGIPMIITIIWACLMRRYYDVDCWMRFAQHPLVFILAVPIVLALLVNSAFLVNIIRVLVVKLRSNNLVESRRIRKAIKATVVLLPLLGVANLLFLAHPVQEGTVIMYVYRIINGLLPSLQGVFVSVLYCFMNSEVQNVIKKKWKRFRTNRAMNTHTRRQGSRTSSYFLSQSEAPRRFASLSKSYITRDRDYHTLTVVNKSPECDTRNGSDTNMITTRLVQKAFILDISTIPENSVSVNNDNGSEDRHENDVDV